MEGYGFGIGVGGMLLHAACMMIRMDWSIF